MVFVSWIVSSTYANKMASTENRLNQIANERWLYDGLSSIELNQRNQGKTLYHMNREIMGVPESWRENKSAAEFYRMTRELGISQEFSADISNLVKFAWRTQHLAERIGVDDELGEKITLSSDSAVKLSDEFWKARKKYEDKQMKLFDKSVSASEITENKINELYPIFEEYTQVYRSIYKQYLPIKNRIIETSSELYQQAESRANSAKLMAGITSNIALIIYFLGSILAIAGKWIEVHQKANKSIQPTANASAD